MFSAGVPGLWRLLQTMLFRAGTPARRPNPRGKSAIYWRECACGPSGSIPIAKPMCFQQGLPGERFSANYQFFFALRSGLGGRIQKLNRQLFTLEAIMSALRPSWSHLEPSWALQTLANLPSRSRGGGRGRVKLRPWRKPSRSFPPALPIHK